MKTFLTVLLSFALFALNGQETVNLQLKWWHQFQFAGYYAAQQKGYYAEAGLDVNIKPGGPEITVVDEVVSGRADFGISGSDLVLDFSNGSPVVALGAIFQHSPYAFMTLSKSQIVHPGDLVGKTVMVCDNQGWAEMRAALLLEGICPDSIKIIEHSWNNNDLANGKADAISAYCTVEPWQMAGAGIETHLIRPVNYGIDFYGDILFTSTEVLNNNPELVEKFRRASFQGWEYALNNTEEIISYILTLPGVKERGTTREQLLCEATEMKKIILQQLVEIGHMNIGRWRHIHDTYSMLGLVAGNIPLDEFVYNPLAEQQSGYSRKLFQAGIGFFILVLLTLIVYVAMKKVVRNTRNRLELEIRSRLDAQVKLSSTEEFLDTAVTGASLGIWSLDMETDRVEINNVWKSMLGYDSEEIRLSRQTLLDLIHPADRMLFERNLYDHVKGKCELFEGAVRMKTKSGNWKWILTKAKTREWNANGNARRITGIHFDLDNIKQKESELLEISEELLRKNKELRQFSYVISHNMRAPVASIAGLLQLVQPELRESDSMGLISKVEVCTQQLLNTMQDLNNILNAKDATVQTADRIQLAERARMVCEMLRDRLEPIGARVQIDPAMTQHIWFPVNTYDGILLHLLTNAIKFRNVHHLLRIEIFAHEDEHFVHLGVKDNGVGIDTEQYGDKVFGIYSKFHGQADGKGLGLYISKTQLESLGGKIELQSTPGRGATFIVSFPKEPHCRLPGQYS